MRGASSHRLLRFAWRDAGSGKAPKASSSAPGHTSLKTEHAVALFALAAELARAAAEEDRRTPDGIRRACAALADAASALSVADAKVCVASEASGLRYMTGTRLAAFECLELAQQAHECYFELTVAGGKPASLCSKIAQQVSQDYHRLSGCFVNLGCQNDHQQNPIDKSWVPHTQAKRTYFHAGACHLHARALLEKGPGCAGEAVAWLRYALSAVLDGAPGKAAIKRSAAPVRDAAAWLWREVESELAAAEKDNCQVYCKRVPAADALTPLPGLSAPLVRASSEEKVLREPDGDAAVARGGAPTARH